MSLITTITSTYLFSLPLHDALPICPAAWPRACQEFLVTFVSETKVTRQKSLRSKPGETAFSGFCASKTVLLNEPWLVSQKTAPSCVKSRAKPLLTLRTPAVSRNNPSRPSACEASGAKQCLADFAQQNRAFK